MEYRAIVKEARKTIRKIKWPHQPLTPISCSQCGRIGTGRWANRSTVCWQCRRKWRNHQKDLMEYENL